MAKGKKSDKKGGKSDNSEQQQPSGSKQQQQPSGSEQQQQPSGSEQQQPSEPRQQQQLPASSQQQQWPHVSGQQQQRPPGPGQEQQRPPGPGQQQQRPSGPGQQQQRPPGPGQQQQRPPGPGQQQQRPPAWGQQQQRPPGPGQQQQRPPGPGQQQQWQPGPGQQEQRPPGPGQQQQRPPGPGQQQQRSPGPGQQQQRPPGPGQQQQWQPGPGQQQQRPPGPGQQQQWQPGPGQQEQRPPGPGQQQQWQPGPGQQQQRPPGPGQQQQWQPGPGQQEQRPPGPGQQQQRPPGPGQQQQRSSEPGQQQQQPPGPGQQQQRPPEPGHQQQQTSESQQLCDLETAVSKTSLSKPSVPMETALEGLLPHVPPIVTRSSVTGRYIVPYTLQNQYMSQIPKRSGLGGGRAGRPITVETNMFKIVFNKNFQENIIHYDVVIEPDKPKFLMRPVFELYRKKNFPNRYPAFDGKQNAYSAQELPFGDRSKEQEIKVFDEERQQERSFKMYMKKVASLNLAWLKNIKYGLVELHSEQRCVQALDVILQHGSANHHVSVGSSLFPAPEPGRVVSISGGMDLWIGLFQSAIVGWRPYLNVDVAHKAFPMPQSVINLMKELCQDPRSRTPLQHVTAKDVEYNSEKITKFLKGLKIQYEIPGQPHSKRTYRVNGLVGCPRNNEFRLDDGSMCTVENYFLQTKKYRLEFPDLPCLWVGSRNSEKKIHLPVELCTIVAGQVTQKKMDETQTSKMIRYAATDTHTRKQRIMNGFAKMRLNQQPTLMKEFDLSVQGEFEKVPARVLQAPKLKYKENEVNVFKGVWRADKFLSSCELPDNSWTILNLDRYVQDRELYDGLHNKLQAGGKFVNMWIGKALTPFTTLSVQRNINNILQYFTEKKEQNLRLVVVIIPNLDDAYSIVKQISELKITGGIVTQCLKSQTLKKLSDATITNILLKINSKLNGVNHTFAPTFRPACLAVPCMLVGADVTHPSPDAVNIPSIAAVAASHDPNAFRYNIELRLQPPREEIIQDLQMIMHKQLLYFFRATGKKPIKIIFYRDGVSEGQLAQVMHFEISAIKKAIANLEKDGQHKIALTFLVVQKRHHIRLFPTDQRNSDDRNFNVQAGTIVDTEITHPTFIDFYLVSHASIQGTARPTKYRCICDENKMTEDEIEQLTYYLCHMFARCTKSVSYPAPTYYAHLAAFRARALIRNVSLNMENLIGEQQKNMTLQMTNSPMFFV
ncbi:protein argonaute-2 isoform X2 [Colletes gigas]|uniref:protein argonaute-2 isoform X2 n=1 Tax=Colletes gigas TaxID=935657 RepID=UPI001C9AB597|nr:protein argonaute-2 isoform X2 [Colletes gigas]